MDFPGGIYGFPQDYTGWISLRFTMDLLRGTYGSLLDFNALPMEQLIVGLPIDTLQGRYGFSACIL